MDAHKCPRCKGDFESYCDGCNECWDCCKCDEYCEMCGKYQDRCECFDYDELEDDIDDNCT